MKRILILLITMLVVSCSTMQVPVQGEVKSEDAQDVYVQLEVIDILSLYKLSSLYRLL